MMGRHAYLVVKLEDGCWLAEWEGDPPRTCKAEHAARFASHDAAVLALASARRYRPFRWARIQRVEARYV